MATLNMPRIVGTAWVSNDDGGGTGYKIEGEACRVEVERTDENEIAVHVMVGGAETEDAGLYLTDAEAFRLMATIGRTILETN